MKNQLVLLLLIGIVLPSVWQASEGLEIILPVVNCENAKADIVFVLDSSGSVGVNNFQKMLTFIRGIISRFNVGIDYMRVALVRFNTQVIPEFQLNQFTHIENLLERMEAVQYTTGTTNMAGALRQVWEKSFLEENGGRPEARRIAILISDGRSDNRVWTTNEAVRCKDRNVTLFALGIGKGVDRDELQDIGTDPDSKHVIFYDDFDSLNGTQILIADSVCTYSKPKLKPQQAASVIDTGMDGGTIAGIVFGVLILLCLILAYPAYILSKRYIFGEKKKKKKSKKPKRPKTAANKKKGSHHHRGKSAGRHRRPPSRGSDGLPRYNSHKNTPLRPGTGSLSRQSSYGSFEPDPRPNYSRHMAEDNIPLRPVSRSSDSSGSTFGRFNSVSQDQSRGSSVIDGAGRAMPPGLERAISLMRRQKTLTQHPAPGQMAQGMMAPPMGLGGRQGTMMAPPMGLGGRQGTMMAPPMGLGGRQGTMMTPGGFMLRERTMAGADAGPVAPTAFIKGPPPPGFMTRQGTILGPPPPNMDRRQGTSVAPPPAGLQRERTGMMGPPKGPPIPPPAGFASEAMGPPPPSTKRERPAKNRAQPLSIPEEADAAKDEVPRTKADLEVHHPPKPPAEIINPPDENLSAKVPAKKKKAPKLPPIRSKTNLPDEEGAIDPMVLADRLKSLEAPIPQVILQGPGDYTNTTEL